MTTMTQTQTATPAVSQMALQNRTPAASLPSHAVYHGLLSHARPSFSEGDYFAAESTPAVASMCSMALTDLDGIGRRILKALSRLLDYEARDANPESPLEGAGGMATTEDKALIREAHGLLHEALETSAELKGMLLGMRLAGTAMVHHDQVEDARQAREELARELLRHTEVRVGYYRVGLAQGLTPVV